MKATNAHQSGNAVSPDETTRRLEDTLFESLKNRRQDIIKSPTGSGKSYTVSITPWRDLPAVTGGQPVIHIHETRKARDESAEHSEKAGIRFAVVKNRKELCSVARGDHDDDLPQIDGQDVSRWIDQKCDIENRSYVIVHQHLQTQFGDLPCGDCDAIRQWDNLLRNEDGTPTYDVVHATGNFLHIADLVKDANIIFDEQPDYTIGYRYRNIQKTGLH